MTGGFGDGDRGGGLNWPLPSVLNLWSRSLLFSPSVPMGIAMLVSDYR